MTLDVVSSATIGRPRDEVAAAAVDPDQVRSWYRNISSAQWLTPPPLAVGTLLSFRARFLGRELAYTYRVEEHAPGRRFVMRTSEGPFPMETTYTWEDAGDGATRMTLRNRGRPSGWSRLLAPVMGRAVARATRQDLARLTRLLESRA